MKLSAVPLQRWINENREALKPPVGNKCIWKDHEFIVMAVGGPNSRTDYHYNEGEELFFQIEGTITLKVVSDGQFQDIEIGPGDIFLLPPKTPHSPQRPAGSVGLVVERERRAGERDGLLWFCKHCHHKLYEEYFELTDIETQFPAVFERYYSSRHTTCPECGEFNGKI